MAQRSRIIELDLEQQTLRHRANGLSSREIAAKLTADSGEEIGYKAVQRYLERCDVEASVAVVHAPRHAETATELSLDVGQRAQEAVERFARLVEIAENEGGEDGPHWYGLSVASRESREWARLYLDQIDRLYSADRIAQIQRALVTVLKRQPAEFQREFQEAWEREVRFVGMAQ